MFEESGDYTFSVQALGDGVTYTDGVAAVSDVWTYIAPTEKLAAPEKLYWRDGLTPCWSKVEGAATYLIDYYLESADPWGSDQIGGTYGFSVEQDAEDSSMVYFKDDGHFLMMLDHFGSGSYYFKVRALSPDITAVANGDFSAASASYQYVNIASDLERWRRKLTTKVKRRRKRGNSCWPYYRQPIWQQKW